MDHWDHTQIEKVIKQKYILKILINKEKAIYELHISKKHHILCCENIPNERFSQIF